MLTDHLIQKVLRDEFGALASHLALVSAKRGFLSIRMNISIRHGVHPAGLRGFCVVVMVDAYVNYYNQSTTIYNCKQAFATTFDRLYEY